VALQDDGNPTNDHELDDRRVSRRSRSSTSGPPVVTSRLSGVESRKPDQTLQFLQALLAGEPEVVLKLHQIEPGRPDIFLAFACAITLT
jgi:hypothetical protein